MTSYACATPALVLIDVQNAIDHPKWKQHGPRNHPDAEREMVRLLAAWRQRRLPVYHVRHDSTFPDSPYRPGQPGNDFKPEAAPLPEEPVIVKRTNCAFIGTDFERRLRAAGHTSLVIAGVITNNSVETTVRVAGNMGFETWLAEDACFTFAMPDWTGRLRTAGEIHALSLANLHGEYCTVVTVGYAIGML
ncbi:MAG: cysteine hydrolase family protein [Bryobacteraceae bacterium]